MGKMYDAISAEHSAFINGQPLFFVASAPLAAGGHVNLSPKGLDTFRIVDPTTVMYLDLTGSGNETAAHIAENGRMTIMFCAFTGNPKVLRLYCRARIVTRNAPDWNELRSQFPAHAGVRQLFVCQVEHVHTSCGFGVPLMSLQHQRDQLPRWAESKGDAGLVEYRRTRNAVSIDGLLTPATDI